MTWLTPWSAFWLLVALVPILLALYILRLRRARQLVPCTSLWTEAAEDVQANTPFQRLRRNLLLLLQLIALLLIALAIAQPRIEAAAGRGERTVLLFDCSASMQAFDGGGGRTRFEAAADAAMDAVDRLHPGGWFSDQGGQTMIVSLGAGADIVQPFTGSRSVLRAAIGRLEPQDTTAELGDGLNMARAWASEPNPDEPRALSEPARIEVFTDGGLIDLDDVATRGNPIMVHLVGEGTAANRTVQSVAAERSAEDPDAVQVFASLWNWTIEPRDERVQMSLDGGAVHIEDVRLPAGRLDEDGAITPGRRDMVFTPATRPDAVLVEVRLIGDDIFPLDDVAWTVVPARELVRVMLAAGTDSMMARALRAVPGVTLQEFSDDVSSADVLVLDRVDVSILPDAPTLSIDTTLPSSMVSWNQRRGPESMAIGDFRHPVLRGGSPVDLWVGQPQGVAIGASVRAVLRGEDGPLVLAWEEAGHRRVHIAFDPARSSWPWDPTFMSFLVDTLDWLAWRSGGETAGNGVAGGSVAVRLPEGVEQAVAISIRNELQPLRARSGGRAAWGPVTTAGPWLVRWDAPQRGHSVVAVQLPAAIEGDLSRPEQLMIGGEAVDSGASLGRSVPLWPWAIGASLLVLMIEWAVFTRRIA
jgi:Ca-activated chloride channel family protein